MHLTCLILLLLVVLAANVNPIVAIKRQSSVSHTSSHRVLTGKTTPRVKSLHSRSARMTSIATGFKTLLRKNSGLRNNVGSPRQNSEIVNTLEKMPEVKKMQTAVESNPTLVKTLSNSESIKKLAKDSQVTKVSAVLAIRSRYMYGNCLSY